MLTLAGPPPRPPWPALDPAQAAAVAHRGDALLVRGAAGTGKTLVALSAVVDRLGDAASGSDVLLLTPTRRSAARLRDELSARLRRTAGPPVVRTAASLAFSILRARAVLLGEPAPTLISGPEQDLVLADLLAGHLVGEGTAVTWPPGVPAGAPGLRAFRDELRDLLMRAAERGLRPADLARLADRHGRAEWLAAAAVYEEYLDVTRLRSGTPDAGARYDPAVVLDEATEALLAWQDEVPGAPRPRWRAVVVDDYQEATAATARLLHALADDGAELLLLADPDCAVQTFRGASPALVGRASLPVGSELGAFGADELVLGTAWRHGATLRAVVRAVTDEIRGPGRGHRAAVAGAPDVAGPAAAEVRLLRSPAQESAYVAYRLRAAHLHDGVPWSSMAVVVRSGAQVTGLRRALVAAQVPVTVLGSDVPLRAEPAVRPILGALAAVLAPGAITADDAVELLTSPLGGLDAVAVRRLRRALRDEELSRGGGRSS
ncbi:MAG TPA: ATP-dependent helicase, partial [Actinotalea sp.]|nr:ATP-dependent helicase [Actinotalea sp.]